MSASEPQFGTQKVSVSTDLTGPSPCVARKSHSLLTQLLGSSDASEARAATLAQYDAELAYLDRLIAAAEGLLDAGAETGV